MRPLTLFEHDRVHYSQRKELQDEAIIRRIKELNIRYGFKNVDNGIFTLYRDYIQASSYVGFALFDSLQVQVLPKIYRNERDVTEKKQAEALEVFLKMLDIIYGFKFKIKEHELTKLLETGLQSGIHEVFIYLFAKALLAEIEKGIYREYVEMQSEESYLRGKLLLTKQIKKLPHKRHTFSIEFYDFTENNPLNQIFYSTILSARNRTQVHMNRKLLSRLALIFADVTPRRILKSQIERIHFTRINERFKHPFKLATILLFGFKGIFGEERTFGFFVDMNHLFQNYVYAAIKKAFPRHSVLHEKEIGSLTRNRTLTQRPDIVILEKNRIKLVIDVKYKEISEDELITSGDLYQIYAYSKLAGTDVVLIYPRRENFNEWLTERVEIEFFDGGKVIILPFELSDIVVRRERAYLPESLKQELKQILGL